MGFKRKRAVRKFGRSKRMRMVVHNARPLAVRAPRRRRSVFSQSSRQLNSSNPFAFRSKKLSKKAYRRALYNATRFKTHYRTVFAATDTQPTPNNVTFITATAYAALSTLSLSEFWHSTTGGLQDPSFGEVPSWAGATDANDPLTIILRGGRLWMTCSLGLGTVDTCKIRVQLVFAKQGSRNVTDTAASNTVGIPGAAGGWLGTTGINVNGAGFTTGTTRPIGWDISQAPDFEEYFYKPVVDRSMDLKAGDAVTVYWKVKPVKIDVGPFKDGACYAPYWFVYLGQDNNSNAALENVVTTLGHNMSFAVGDTLT